MVDLQACDSTFVKCEIHGIFDKKPRRLSICKHDFTEYYQGDLGTMSRRVCGINSQISLTGSQDISSCVCGENRRTVF